MTDRLSKLIKSTKMSASQFADEIGVQRSSVSHVLSGRNKPSLDFITKILFRFPETNAEWLLTGKGDMLKGAAVNATEEISEGNSGESYSEESSGRDELTDSKPLIADRAVKKETGKVKPSAGPGNIEKIVFFYNNGSFEEYQPKG